MNEADEVALPASEDVPATADIGQPRLAAARHRRHQAGHLLCPCERARARFHSGENLPAGTCTWNTGIRKPPRAAQWCTITTTLSCFNQLSTDKVTATRTSRRDSLTTDRNAAHAIHDFGRRTGLRISQYALSTGNFGSGCGEAKAIFDRFVEAGENFIATADTYQTGESEQLVGEFLHTDRDDLVSATKFTVGANADLGIPHQADIKALNGLRGGPRRVDGPAAPVF